jgi:hypothetical protein
MQKKKTTSLLVVLRKPNPAKWREYANDLLLVDHVLHILPRDLVINKNEDDPETQAVPWANPPCSNLHLFLRKVNTYEGLDEIAIMAERGTSAQLMAILDELLPKLVPDGSLSVAGFQISASAFHRMIETCEYVTLLGCHLARGWWKSGSPSAKCSSLNIKYCDGIVPKRPGLGQGTWPALNDILVWESDWIAELIHNSHRILNTSTIRGGDDRLTQALVTALWNPAIDDLHICGARNLGWLSGLPPSKALASLWLNGSAVSLDVFEWILRNRSLYTLALSWYPETRLPWGELKKLKRVRQLDLEDSHLDDEQLAEIARVTTPHRVDTYGTALTSRSWRTILTWPGLKSFIGSQELVEGEFPQDLPDSTRLKKCIAMNADTDRYRAVLARYPDVEVVEM